MRLFLYILLALDQLVCLASPTGESEYPIVNLTHSPLSRRDQSSSELLDILTLSWFAGNMLEDGKETDEIAIKSARFDEKDPWSISCYNSQTATVITILTSQGGIIVKIPATKMANVVTSQAKLKPDKYRELIFDPLLGQNGKLPQLLRKWQDDSGGWWPDALRLIVSTPGSSAKVQIPKNKAAVYELEKDLPRLWAFPINPEPGMAETLQPKAQNILDDQRTSLTTFQSRIYFKSGWENHQVEYSKHKRDPGQNGYAIQWQKTEIAGEYRIWIGDKSRDKPFAPPDEDYSDGDVLFRLDNERGWYPASVQALGAEPPGEGCYYKPLEC